MKLVKTTAPEEENVIKESAIVMKASQGTTAVLECALEIAQETDNVIKEYAYVIRDSKESSAKKPKYFIFLFFRILNSLKLIDQN